MNALRSFDAWWMREAPRERLAALRVLCGAFAVVYLLVRAPVLADFRGFVARDFEPVGAASWLGAPVAPTLLFALYLITLASGIAFTLGLWFRVAGPAFALALLALTSYRNSWGMIFHTDNLLVVHVGVLALAPCAAVRSLDARRSSAGTTDPRAKQPSALCARPAASFGWPVRLLCVVTVLAYALAGVAKLKISGVGWVHGEILRNYIAYDAVRKAQVGSIYSPLGGWLVQYAWPFPIVGALTLLLELGGVFTLWSSKLARLWCLGMFAFHVGVLATMAIAFPYPLSFVAFAPFFEAEKLWSFPLARQLLASKPDPL